MNFQQLTIKLLDDIYQAASRHISTFDPQHAAETYLKVLIEPLSPEAHVWVNSSFNEFGDHIHYEIFRQLAEGISHNQPTEDASHSQRAEGADHNLLARKRGYLQTSLAIACLLGPDDPQNIPGPAAATCLRIVCQKPHELVDFLNLYIAIFDPLDGITQAALGNSIAAVERFLINFDPYYYILNYTPLEKA